MAIKIGQAIKRFIYGRKSVPGAAGIENLKLRYREFKYLLRANNEVLAIIADIENQLLSGAAVGLDYLTSRYISASAKVYKMILHLNRIAGDRYPGLMGAFDQIRHGIDDALTLGGGPLAGALTLPLKEVDRDLHHLVGSKAANLAHAGRLGLPVPDGFVVTTAAFRSLMSRTGLYGQVRQAVMLLDDPSYTGLTRMSNQVKERMAEVAMPAEIETALDRASDELFQRLGRPNRLSLRSSALGEDSETSFAGQYVSVLNVPREKIMEAYREVVASLYEPQAVVYRRRNDLKDEDAEMAVLVMPMLDSKVAGVMYTRDPRQGENGPLLINSVYGLGRGLVEGALNPDVYAVSREERPRLLSHTLGGQTRRFVPAETGLEEESLPPDLAGRPTLSPEQAEELARMGLILEKAFGRPQDVEWVLTLEGGLYILQSRPLQLLDLIKVRIEEEEEGLELILEGGEPAHPGIGSGPAYLVHQEDDLAGFPDGAVLVARQSSPVFACVLDRAAAVVTDLGGVTGHMASLAREFGVPALVAAKGASNRIKPGQMVTVNAWARRVHAGRSSSRATTDDRRAAKARQPAVMPPWYQAAQLITPLTLTDPRSERFRPAECRTFHDIIRYVHEKSFYEMFRLGDALGREAAEESRRLAHKLPFELLLIDLGGGLKEGGGREVTLDEVISRPGQAFFGGLLDPRIHWDRPRPVSLRGLASVFSSSMLTPVSDGQLRDMGDSTYAIVSTEYLNFNSRVGYHFAALDSVCGPVLNDNYISFRFQGGAATEDRRTLRAQLIARILDRLGFDIRQKGDLVHVFIKKMDEQVAANLLAELGRLILFTRQMDMLCHDLGMVDYLARAFEAGNFDLDPGWPAAVPETAAVSSAEEK
ncbi:MAG: PEP/pyruvate-binding domain-containing protein [Thermodesulfobacteriota bacterium]